MLFLFFHFFRLRNKFFFFPWFFLLFSHSISFFIVCISKKKYIHMRTSRHKKEVRATKNCRKSWTNKFCAFRLENKKLFLVGKFCFCHIYSFFLLLHIEIQTFFVASRQFLLQNILKKFNKRINSKTKRNPPLVMALNGIKQCWMWKRGEISKKKFLNMQNASKNLEQMGILKW